MQDYQFRDPVVIVKCQAYTGAVAATVKDQGVCVWTIEVLYAMHTCFIAYHYITSYVQYVLFERRVVLQLDQTGF